MKILMLTPYLPYPTNSGGQIRSFNLIKHLAKKHEITLCSLIKHEEDRKYVKHLKPFCKEVYAFKRPEKPFTISNIVNTALSTLPFLVVRNFSKDLKKALPELIEREKFDIIHAETFYISPHIPPTDIPVVLVDQTIEFQVYEHYVKHFKYSFLRPILYLDVLKLKYWESYYWKKVAKVIAVSERDAQIMHKFIPEAKVSIVPNGVGEDLIADVPLHFNKTILFMGNYSWLQNVEAATILREKVFPLVLQKIPDAKLVIAGQYTERLKLKSIKNIQIKDFAIDDIESVQEQFRNSGVLVSPLYGPGGTRLKILGAMAAKLPVITTTVGIAGIHAEHMKQVLIGESYEELASLTTDLLQNKEKYKGIAENARKFVEDNFFYEAITEKLDSAYQDVIVDRNV